MPQVHGAVKDTLDFVSKVIETEINSATDNPTIFPDEDLVISAGNFHGEPIAIPMDSFGDCDIGTCKHIRTAYL